MPRRLLERCQEDSIQQYRIAARKRFDDGLILAAAGRRTAAIYLWGYTAEMTLKAAYFSHIGIRDSDTISWRQDLRPAIQRGRSLGIVWPPSGDGHNVRAWAELLVLSRSTSIDTTYPPLFGHEIQRHGQQFEPLWRESLRYRKNHAYLHEVRRIRVATEWFLVRSEEL